MTALDYGRLVKELRRALPGTTCDEAANAIEALTERAEQAEAALATARADAERRYAEGVEAAAQHLDGMQKINDDIANEYATAGDPGMAEIHAQTAEQHGRDAAAVRALITTPPAEPEPWVEENKIVKALTEAVAFARGDGPARVTTFIVGVDGAVIRCFDCGEPYGSARFPDLIVPNDIWRAISPTRDEGGMLCPNCIAARLERGGFENVPAKFTSGAMALALLPLPKEHSEP